MISIDKINSEVLPRENVFSDEPIEGLVTEDYDIRAVDRVHKNLSDAQRLR